MTGRGPMKRVAALVAAVVAVLSAASCGLVGGSRPPTGTAAVEPAALGSQLAAVQAAAAGPVAPPVTWVPPTVPTTVDGMQRFLRTLIRCDEVEPFNQDRTPGAFSCSSGGTRPGDRDLLYVLPMAPREQAEAGQAAADAPNAFAAAWDGYRFARYLVSRGKVDGFPATDSGVGCLIVASAGPWSFQYAETHRLADEPTEISRVIEALDAVVHEDCAKPGLAPDTLGLVAAMPGNPACEVERVGHAPLPGGVPTAVDWMAYDVAFSCSNGYTLHHIPPGTEASFARFDAGQLGCRPFVVVNGRWLVHQPATTARPARYDRSVLDALAATFATRVVDPCPA